MLSVAFIVKFNETVEHSLILEESNNLEILIL